MVSRVALGRTLIELTVMLSPFKLLNVALGNVRSRHFKGKMDQD